MDISEKIINCIQNQKPISFSKYGDGEYNCMIGIKGHNCDRDTYTSKLRQGLLESFQYMVSIEHSYQGVWHTTEVKEKFQKLVPNCEIKWAKYHTLILDRQNDESKVKIYKTIKESKIKKIYVCNELMIKAKELLNIDYMIHVPFQNWFDNDFESVMMKIKSSINNDEPHIVLTSCGMSAKVLIYELTKIYKNGIYLDIGSGIDFLCTKKDSRGREYSYDYLIHLMEDLIPKNWEDDKYIHIYQESKKKLGIHL